MNCRHCGSALENSFLDLGSAPPSNSYLSLENLQQPETWYPLRVMVCQRCWLVQTEDFSRAEELFSPEYAYFSSFSRTWLEHAKRYTQEVVERFQLNHRSKVIEVAANDGYLLQYIQERGIPCLGIEPTASTAEAARRKGLSIIGEFFGVKLAKKLADDGQGADLMAANNVLAHTPDINDFVKGFPILLKPQGVATFEFPHLQNLVKYNQFDTIYHEHFSYLSLSAVNTIFNSNGLEIFDVERLATHGGSLRVFAQRRDGGSRKVGTSVQRLLDEEMESGMLSTTYYTGFQQQAEKVKNELLDFLLEAHRRGFSVGAYGAAAKGNTLLNFSGVRPDLVSFVVDRNPDKQQKFMPGSRIPIVDESFMKSHRPDRILILPWNLKEEIVRQLAYARDWGAQFVTAVPRLEIS